MEIRIKGLKSGLRRVLTHIEKNAHYALCEAMTNTVYQAREHEAKLLAKKYTLRTSWVIGGLKVRKAGKEEKKPEAVVGFVRPEKGAKIAELHEQGGQHEKVSGHDLGIPLAARPSKEKTTPPSKWPKAYLNRGPRRMKKEGVITEEAKYFEIQTKKGKYLVEYRRGQLERRKILKTKRYAKWLRKEGRGVMHQPTLHEKFVFLYKLVKSSPVLPDLHFKAEIPAVEAMFAAHIVKSLHAALRE